MPGSLTAEAPVAMPRDCASRVASPQNTTATAGAPPNPSMLWSMNLPGRFNVSWPPPATPSLPAGEDYVKDEPVKEERGENSLWDVPAESATTGQVTNTDDIDDAAAAPCVALKRSLSILQSLGY
ncbi:hypothetical protein BDW74DRAFT_179162 [Aspergillus multicolor]|uniref:uncharacterized protein n=1 Tax=Aspergillus multicolor TaxID=41759 RepID=UPI003CCCF28C